MIQKNGFTLIEVIVVMAVFLFVIGAALGIFISIILQQRNILAQMELLNEVSYIQEYVSKGMRMAAKDLNGDCLGSDYAGWSYLLTKPNSDTSSSNHNFYMGIKFLNQSELNKKNEPTCEEIYLDTDGVLRETKDGASDGTLPIPLSSSKYIINSIRFGIDGYTGSSVSGPIGDQDSSYFVSPPQAKITILMNVGLIGNTQVPAMNLQTTVSQRNIGMQNY